MYIIHVHGMANVLGHHCDYGDVMYFDVFLAGNIAVLSKDLSGHVQYRLKVFTLLPRFCRGRFAD